ncbi:MAG: capsular polysaccharide transport system permease protein [Glaciecola sp.]|jgi:capsular polysaccharide transport system permease protein
MTTVLKRNKWEIWRDVIFALFTREIKTSFNDKLGISWSVLSPIAFILVLSFIRGRVDGGDTHTIPTFVFMAYGLMLVQMFLETLQSGSSAIKKNKALFAFRQVQPLSAVLAASLFGFLVKVFVLLGIYVFMYFMRIEIIIDNPLLLVSLFVLLWVLAFMIGLLLGILSLYVPELSKIQSLFTRPLFFISGTFFSLQDIPQEYWWLLDWNPILHAIELSRFAAYTSYQDNGVSFNYFAFVVLGASFISLAIYHSQWRQAISR